MSDFKAEMHQITKLLLRGGEEDSREWEGRKEMASHSAYPHFISFNGTAYEFT